MNNLKSGRSISLTGDPYLERDYLHVSDFCAFMYKVINTPKEGTFNIGSGKGLKLIDLFKIAFETFGIQFKENDVVFNKTDSSFSQILNIKLAQQTYGFEPGYSMKTWFLDSVNTK